MVTLGVPSVKRKGVSTLLALEKRLGTGSATYTPTTIFSASGHAEIRRHDKVKEQALQVLRRKKDGAKLVYKLLQIVFERKTNILRVDRVSIVFPEVQILCKN